MSAGMQRMNAPMSVQSWNRSSFPQNASGAGNAHKLLPGYNMTSNPNVMPGANPGYSSMSRGMMSSNTGQGMNSSSAILQRNPTQMQNPTVGMHRGIPGATQPSQMQPHAMGGFHHQQQTSFSQSAMIHNNMGTSQMTTSYGGQADVLDHLSDGMYPQSQSPNIQLDFNNFG